MALKGIKILNYGICQHGEGTTIESSIQSPTGYYWYSDEIEFIQRIDKIELAIGMNFGILYKFVTTQNEAEIIEFQCKIRHPQLINPNTSQKFRETIENKLARSHQVEFDYYTFEFDWELQPGPWIFEIIFKEQIMCTQTFDLYKPGKEK